MPDLFADFPPPSIGPYTGAPLSRRLPETPEAESFGLSSPKDPATSDQAAIEHARSGRLERNEDIVVRIVNDEPGQTALEVHAAQGGYQGFDLDRHEVSRRLSSAMRRGRLKQGPKKRCSIKPNGVEMVTWWPIP